MRQILDVTCGGRQIWEQKSCPDVLYMDIRVREKGSVEGHPNWAVMPDVQGDFKSLPYGDEVFNLVVYDPPHIIRNELKENSFMALKYGKLLLETWKVELLDGFMECWRVLRPGGTLVFKWSEVARSGQQVIDLLPFPPMFGTRGNNSKNGHGPLWYCFYKLEGSG